MKKKPMEQSQLHTSPGQSATHRRSSGHGERPRTPRFRAVLFTMVVALVLSGCILQPDTGRTGSVTLRFTSLNASTSRDGFSAAGVDGEELSVNAIGVFLYGPDGRERRSARVDVSGGSATIQLDDIPEGRGYTIVAVKYTNAEDTSPPVPLPEAMGESDSFSISGGRETRVSLSTTEIDENPGIRYPMEFRGERLVGAGAVGGEIIGATATRIIASSNPETITDLPDGIQINGIFEGKIFDGDNNVVSIPLLATNQGIFPVPRSSGNGETGAQAIAAASLASGASNVQEIIAFVAEEGDNKEIVWIYSRLGGFGGIGFDDNEELANGHEESDWFDAGEDLEDLFDANENPVRAMGTDGVGVAYLATGPLGTFRITEDFENVFDDDDDDNVLSEIIAGRSQEGFTFFGMVPPGRSEAVRINRLGVVSPPSSSTNESNRVIVGTSQGAFWFSGSAIDDLDEGQSNVSGSAVNTIPQLAGERIQDIAVSGTYVALATPRRVLVLERDGTSFKEVANHPTRGVVLGDITRIFIGSTIEASVTTKYLFISGTAGLTVIPISAAEELR